MRMLITAGLVLAATAAPALAQDEEQAFEGGHIALVGGGDQIKNSGQEENGLVYGVTAGYTAQMERSIAGIEVEGTMGTNRYCEAGVCVETGRDLYVGARLGLMVHDQGAVYVKAGYTNAQARFETTAGTKIMTDDLDGVRFGLGAEGRSGKMLFRAEYRYSNYEQDFTRHQIVLGVGIAF